MSALRLCAVLCLAALTGCASLSTPSADKLAALPVVVFPDAPPTGEFILKLPAGQPIPARVAIQGTALASGAEETLHVTLGNDLYVHRRWVSEDLKTWRHAHAAMKVTLALSLPSDEHPRPAEIILTVDKRPEAP